jgi:hypothetical protein
VFRIVAGGLMNKPIQQREEIHLAMEEEIGNIIFKYFPNFDNNIKNETWAMLSVFLDETIYQLTQEN